MMTIKERVINKLLLLYILNKSNELKFGICGRLKLQKIFFLEQWELLKRERKAILFKFFRYNHGPFSKTLADDYDFLSGKRIIYKSLFVPTPDGGKLLKSFLRCSKDLHENKSILKIVDSVIRKWGKYSGTELKAFVYNMKIKPFDNIEKEFSIFDIPYN